MYSVEGNQTGEIKTMITANPIQYHNQEPSAFEVVLEGVWEVKEVLAIIDNYSERTRTENVRLYLLRGGKEVVAERLDSMEDRWEFSPISDWKV